MFGQIADAAEAARRAIAEQMRRAAEEAARRAAALAAQKAAELAAVQAAAKKNMEEITNSAAKPLDGFRKVAEAVAQPQSAEQATAAMTLQKAGVPGASFAAALAPKLAPKLAEGAGGLIDDVASAASTTLAVAKNSAFAVDSAPAKFMEKMGQLGPKIGDIAGKVGIGLRAALLPATIGKAIDKVGAAIQNPTESSISQAVGGAAFATGQTLGTLGQGLKAAAAKVGEKGGMALAIKSGARFVPGLNIAAAAADGVWAAGVISDPKANAGQKITAGITAAASALSATNIPGFSTAGAVISSASAAIHCLF